MSNLRIDGDRLWQSLMAMAEVGPGVAGGSCRLALTDLDRAGRALFQGWAEAAGCTAHLDAMGNLFLRRPGSDPDAAPVMTGSHLDTQPTGGRFDGVYGVLAGLEVMRTLNDANITTRAPLEVVVWTNEEGSRFSPPMIGSGVFAGVFDLSYGLERPDQAGTTTIGAELTRLGWRGEGTSRPVAAYFEAHIEQGPVLEAAGCQIGVVTGAQGQRWYEVTVIGQEAHAGPTPMRLRRDALVASARMIDAVNAIGHEQAPYACATVGQVTVHPNSRNTIPGRVFFTVDFRHPVDATLTAMDHALRSRCQAIADTTGCTLEIKEFWYFPPTPFDPACVAAVRRGAERLGVRHQDIISGAGHDAVYLARVAPTAMIFVPCEGGISHNEVENAKPEDLALGCQILLEAMLERAG
ncbi:MAG: Zn-dependent hydrolase [Alphaproteobacteria bacterium]|nr:Zn-dependent hydrolase [Alphaproteobacteria bacterium]TAD87595.1 MAG: Zn-dependent hydrolase [Alphaproteobacteria bacterium]